MRRITSRQNPLVARFRAAARRREADAEVLLDGEHLVAEAVAAGVAVEVAAVTDHATHSGRIDATLLARLEQSGTDVVGVSDTVMAALSPVREPSGIVALGRIGAASVDDVLNDPAPLVVVLAGVQDAGNVGAILRAADASGATGAIATEGTADPLGWKALRGAMGSTFRLRVAPRARLGDVIDGAARRRIAVVAAVPRGGTPLPDADLTRPAAILLGGEGGGLPDAVVAGADARVTIPMRPPVESLNVAITAALILYEASQQRKHVAVR